MRAVALTFMILAFTLTSKADGNDSLNEIASFRAAGLLSQGVGTYVWDYNVDPDGDGTWWYDSDDTWLAEDNATITLTVPSTVGITIVAAYLYWSPGRSERFDFFACQNFQPWNYPTITVNGSSVTGAAVGTTGPRDYASTWACGTANSIHNARTATRLHRADVTNMISPGINTLILSDLDNNQPSVSNARFVGAAALFVVYDDTNLAPEEKSEIFIADGAQTIMDRNPLVGNLTNPVTHSLQGTSSEREAYVTLFGAGLEQSTYFASGVRPTVLRVDAGGQRLEAWNMGAQQDDTRFDHYHAYDLLAPIRNTGLPNEYVTPPFAIPANADSVTVSVGSLCPPTESCFTTDEGTTWPSSFNLYVSAIEVLPGAAPESRFQPVLLRSTNFPVGYN